MCFLRWCLQRQSLRLSPPPLYLPLFFLLFLPLNSGGDHHYHHHLYRHHLYRHHHCYHQIFVNCHYHHGDQVQAGSVVAKLSATSGPEQLSATDQVVVGIFFIIILTTTIIISIHHRFSYNICIQLISPVLVSPLWSLACPPYLRHHPWTSTQGNTFQSYKSNYPKNQIWKVNGRQMWWFCF